VVPDKGPLNGCACVCVCVCSHIRCYRDMIIIVAVIACSDVSVTNVRYFVFYYDFRVHVFVLCDDSASR